MVWDTCQKQPSVSVVVALGVIVCHATGVQIYLPMPVRLCLSQGIRCRGWWPWSPGR